MYSVGFLFFAAIALGVGSWWALLLLLVAIPVLVLRILDEEKLLEKDLAGYKEYEQKVRFRLLPYIW
jgi:protein-S-isoprenylcysteine O-methyltransferase Ste14